MNSIFFLLFPLAMLIRSHTEAKTVQCESAGGKCKRIQAAGNECKKLPYGCDDDSRVCCKKMVIKRNGEARQKNCRTASKCKKEGGRCLKKADKNSCDTITIDKLCSGRTCTCCLGNNNKCGESSSCSAQGGFCITYKKRKTYCKGGTANKSMCPGNRCACCIMNGGQGTTCTCGKANEDTRIVGGEEVSPRNKYPWMVGILITGFGSEIACGATLINDLYVITAAHCLYNPRNGKKFSAKKLKIVLAEHNQASTNDNIPGVTKKVKVQKTIIYPTYNFEGLGDDIALIKLKGRLDLTSNDEIKQVCLPKDDSNTYEGYDAIVAGWGVLDYYDDELPNTLMEVTVPVYSPKCNGYPEVTDTMLCAGFQEGGKDACSGDSGGPLVVKEGDSYTLIGIVSFGTGCALPDSPGVYTRVSRYLSWIAQNTKDANCSD